jgi:hypothetical protein
MNADEKAVFEFLKNYPGTFVAVIEISRRLGVRRQFQKDRAWARPILRRMELDEILESNQCGEYRLKDQASGTAFKTALKKPGIPLGDTTLISVEADELTGESKAA